MSLSPSDHATRYGKVGASEAPGLLAYSKWESVDQAVAKWIARHEPGYVEPSWPAADRGHRYEDDIFLAYVERTLSKQIHGKIRTESCHTAVHPVHDWLCCTADRLIHVDGVPDRIVQIKFVGSESSRAHWKKGCPDYVAIQELVELSIAWPLLGVALADVVADLGGTTWLGESVYPLVRNEAIEREEIAKLEVIYRTRLEPALMAIKVT